MAARKKAKPAKAATRRKGATATERKRAKATAKRTSAKRTSAKRTSAKASQPSTPTRPASGAEAASGAAFLEVARRSAARCATIMRLEGEPEATPEALREWAEDWWHNDGIPSLEHAGAPTRDRALLDAFVETFCATMTARLKA